MKYLVVCLTFVVLSTIGSCENAEDSCSWCNTNYEHIVISGLPFQRGKSYGEQAKNKIITMINYYKTGGALPPWEECVKFVKDNYILGLENYYPNGLEEMKGIGEGAGVDFVDIIILNARYDLSKWKRKQEMDNKTNSLKSNEFKRVDRNIVEGSVHDEECTAAVALKSATKNKEVLLGQNWDYNEFILTEDTGILLEVHPEPCENIKPFVILTEAGQLGRSGMNAGGLGITANSLSSSGDIFERDQEKYPKGWVPISFLRRMFLEAATFPLGLGSIFNAPRHVSNNLLVATAEDEALNIELTPDSYFITHVPLDKEIYSHSNHFTSQGFLARGDIRDGQNGGSSFYRNRQVIRSLMDARPNITSSSFHSAFRDHVGYPNSVCEHGVPPELAWTSTSAKDSTIASVIYSLSSRRLEICKGPPCMGTYKEISFNFSVPV